MKTFNKRWFRAYAKSLQRALRLTLSLLVLISPFHGLGVSSAAAQNVPTLTHFQGRLTDASNNPLAGANSFKFEIFDALAAGTLLWTETQPAVPVTNGVFAVQLGAVTPLPSITFSGGVAYLQVTVNGNVMTPREQLVATPFAHDAQLLTGRSFSAFVSTDATTQNIAGAKTFTGTVVVPAPTIPGHAATKAYVDAASGTGLLTSTSTWSGQNTFLNLVSVSSDVLITGVLNRGGTALTLGGALNLTGANGNVTSASSITASGFFGNGAGLTGVVAAGGVAKTGDTMTGDLQVGGATASTLSVSGFLTMANLGSAPSASRGRFYFDPTAAAGQGALKVSLDGASFVTLSTGSASGGISSVLANAAQFSGDGTSGNALTLLSSSVTLQGNTVNAASGLVRLNAGGDLQVGGATASTLSASGFLTMANLGSAPAGSTGRLYYDSVVNKLRLHIGSGFVDIATGTVGGGGGSGDVTLAGDQTFTGLNTFNKAVTLSTPSLATVGTQGIDSPFVSMRGQAWDTSGLASANRQMFMRTRVTNETTWKLTVDRGAADIWALDQSGNVVSGASVTASAFFGNGSALTGIVATGGVLKVGDTMTGALNMTNVPVVLTGASGNVTSASSVTASGFFGNGVGLTGVVAPGAVLKAGDTMTGTLNMTNVGVTATGANGNITTASSVTASGFFGNASALTALNATQLTAGTVPSAVVSGNYGNVTGLGALTSALNVTNVGITATGANGNITTASSVTASGFFGDGAGLTSVTGTDSTKLAKAGDTLTGKLFGTDVALTYGIVAASGTITSTFTILGNAFSVGGSTFAVVGGSVGIGIAAPLARLDVDGAILMRGMGTPPLPAAGQGKLYFDSGSGKLKLSESGAGFTNVIGGVGGAVTLQGSTPGIPDTGNINIDGSGIFGRVGVGVNVPGAKAEVRGAPADTYSFRISTSATSYHVVVTTMGLVGIGTTTPASLLDVRGVIGGGGPEGLTVDASGAVGIGITVPVARLHTNTGLANVKGEIVRGAAAQTANLAEWQDSTTANLALISAAGELRATGIRPNIAGTAQWTSGGLLQATDGTVAGPALSFFTEPDSGFYVPATGQIAMATQGLERSRTDNYGQVGIGIAAPTAQLQVSSASATAADRIFIVSTNTALGSEVLAVMGNGRVGVNFAVPAQVLHVASPNTGRTTILIDNRSSAAGASGALNFAKTGSDRWSIFTDLNQNNIQDLSIYDTAQGFNRIYVSSYGGVGINGVTVPLATMDLGITNTPSVIPTLNFRGITTPTFPSVSQSGQAALYYDIVAGKLKLSENGGAYANLIGSVANAVTLLPTTPGAADTGHMNITGHGRFQQGLDISSPTAVAANSVFSVSSDVPSGLPGTQLLVVKGDGKVGIGMTNPVATLDIGGTGAFKMPVGTTAQRPSPVATGMMRFNTDTISVEYFSGTTWLAAAAVSSAPIATGGTETTIIDGGVTYKIHTFTANGTFTVTAPGYVEVLVVGGGGSGGNHNTTNANGGGGGGGVIYRKAFAVTPQAYTVTVGAGGTAIGFQVVSRGNTGANSVFSTLTAYGGGGGGSTGVAGRAYNGGSGGGGAFYGGNAGGGASIQRDGYGNDGGRSYVSWTGGGGGGAGSVGNSVTIAPNDGPDGNGGRGLGVSITGSLVFYAGGGGGGGNSSERAGDGYDGGGRGFGMTTFYDYNTYPVGTNASTGGSSTPHALANTGGGGGAGSYWSNNSTGWAGSKGSGDGGSGIVIVRYIQSQ